MRINKGRVFRRGLLTAIVGVALAGLAGPSPALASCIRPLPPAEALQAAPIAFVGTVISVSGQGRVADVAVESVWVGSGVPRRVVVDGRLSDGGVTSVDRTFEVGAHLLFMPEGKSSPFRDIGCSATTPYVPALAALKPAGAHDPEPGGASTGGAPSPSGTPPVLALVVLLGVLGVGAAAFAVRRGRLR